MRKYFHFFLIIVFTFIACLKAKKSPFDFNTPGGFIFGFIGNSQGSQTFSISGNITGLGTGTLILQNNSGNDLTLTGVDKYSFTGLSSGAVYSISVKSHPTGLACTLTKAKGTISANITDAHINCTAATANALYTLGDATKSYWLDYVKSDGTSPLDATGTACTGSESGYYNACIHAGEFKKVTIPNITSCDGITASDSLSAFNWKCIVATDGSVSVISTGLRGDKGLSDLIDFTSPGSFRNNFVTILLSGNSFLTSATGKWWDNSIVVNNSGGVLSATKTIYIVNTSANITSEYRLNAVDKVALLVMPGIIKSTTSSLGMATVTNKFLWLEGTFIDNYGMSNTLINISSTSRFTVLRNINLTGTTGNTTGIMATSASNLANSLYNIRIANVSVGLHMNSNGVFLNQVNVSNCISCFKIYQSDMVILNSLAFNGLSIAGFESTSASYSNNLYLNNTAANQSANGFYLVPGAGTINKTTYHNVLSVNNTFGIRNEYAVSTKYINLISADNITNNQFYEVQVSSSSIMNGILKLGAGFPTVVAMSGILSNGVKTNGSETTPATETGVTLTNSFVGKVTSTDTKNTSNTNGISAVTPTDWFNFSNSFRGFGNDGGAFPVSANRGNCTNNCRIWDWSLKSTDTIARNVNACPNGTIFDTHQWSAAAANQAFCDTNYKGSSLSGGFCVTTFLRNAVEIFGDGVGNENGICESSEECLYTPNIGAYQGHSSDSTNPSKLIPASQASTTTTTCSDVTTGTVSNVKLWKYDTNGY